MTRLTLGTLLRRWLDALIDSRSTTAQHSAFYFTAAHYGEEDRWPDLLSSLPDGAPRKESPVRDAFTTLPNEDFLPSSDDDDEVGSLHAKDPVQSQYCSSC